MNSPLKIAIYVLKGKFIHIDSAENGNNCNCKCFKCGELLTAKQGDKRTSHFSHRIDTDCTGGNPETLRHKLAKQILVGNSEITISENNNLLYSDAKPEKPFSRLLKPDVTAISNGKDIYFEVWAENAKDEKTKDIYKANRLRCIEINLSQLPFDSSYEEIKFAVLQDYTNKKEIGWVDVVPVTDIEPKTVVAPAKENSFWDLLLDLGKVLLAIVAIIKFLEFLEWLFTTPKRVRR